MLGICTALSHLRRSTHPLQSTMALMDEISARLHRQDDASFNDEVSPLSSAQLYHQPDPLTLTPSLTLITLSLHLSLISPLPEP